MLQGQTEAALEAQVDAAASNLAIDGNMSNYAIIRQLDQDLRVCPEFHYF